MRCFVIGGAGFIGSHLVDRLIDGGHTHYTSDEEVSITVNVFVQKLHG